MGVSDPFPISAGHTNKVAYRSREARPSAALKGFNGRADPLRAPIARNLLGAHPLSWASVDGRPAAIPISQAPKCQEWNSGPDWMPEARDSEELKPIHGCTRAAEERRDGLSGEILSQL